MPDLVVRRSPGQPRGLKKRAPSPSPLEARRWVLAGRVQGVGFRPFVYRLAHRYHLTGWVQNQRGQVEVLAQGNGPDLEAFGHDLVRQAPPLARPEVRESIPVSPAPLESFVILPSEESADTRIHVPPDYFTCDACLAELEDPGDRRYRYPFINCTQCGPRYTLIARLPYDRPHTSMAGFPLCPDCAREYADPMDRRFHAEPVACPVCGPRLTYHAHDGASVTDTAAALSACVEALRAGQVVAVKGIGGYHLMCDARLDAPVARLRARKPRPHKPLAVMFPLEGADGLAAVREAVELTAQETELLRGPLRPIVLARRRARDTLSSGIAPGLAEVGVMLPYSPLHHLLLRDFGGPLVATSANLSGEPVLTRGQEVEERLARVADAFLHHDRPILRPADDPVFRSAAGAPRPLRIGRGSAPLELHLPLRLARPLLALGAHMKNTVALAWEDRVVVSPHIGDMGTPRSLSVLEQLTGDLQELYGVRAEVLVHDAHPGYATTRWASRQGLPSAAVLHHHAHASALVAEAGVDRPCLVFTWDGVGLGEDGTLWGGESFLGHPGAWRRVATFRRFRLPGGERAAREPWRSAASLCWTSGRDWPRAPAGADLVRDAWARGLNAPETSAVGRLFDAAAALTGRVLTASYEGQGPMGLEAIADPEARGPELPLVRQGDTWVADWAPLVDWLTDDARPVEERAGGLHDSLARVAAAVARAVREETGVADVGLCGGVFQNRLLTERAAFFLTEAGFRVHLNREVPPNDGGISFGQVIEYGARARP